MSDQRRGTWLSLGAAFTAGGFVTVYKAAGQQAPLDVIVLAMLLMAAVLNSATALASARGLPRFGRTSLAAAGALAVLTVAGNIGITESLARLEPAVTSVLVQTQVLFVALAGWLALRERVTARYAVGSAIAIVGFAVMRLPGAEEVGVDVLGAVGALVAALCFALMQVVTRAVIHRIRPREVNALRLWMACGLLALLPGRARGLLDLDLAAWSLALGAAFCGPFLSRLCLMYAVRYISAAPSILIGLVSPVFALGLGFAAFGSIPSAVQLAGGLVILLGVAIPVLEYVTSAPARGARGGSEGDSGAGAH